MKNQIEINDVRWQVVKAMLDEDSALREKVRAYIET